jgi:hypothetical protein
MGDSIQEWMVRLHLGSLDCTYSTVVIGPKIEVRTAGVDV